MKIQYLIMLAAMVLQIDHGAAEESVQIVTKNGYLIISTKPENPFTIEIPERFENVGDWTYLVGDNVLQIREVDTFKVFTGDDSNMSEEQILDKYTKYELDYILKTFPTLKIKSDKTFKGGPDGARAYLRWECDLSNRPEKFPEKFIYFITRTNANHYALVIGQVLERESVDSLIASMEATIESLTIYSQPLDVEWITQKALEIKNGGE